MAKQDLYVRLARAGREYDAAKCVLLERAPELLAKRPVIEKVAGLSGKPPEANGKARAA